MGAPAGNQNAARGRVWRQAIERALAKRSRVEQVDAMSELADKLVTLAMSGDLGALKELGDRLEGKPAQAVEMTGAEGGPVQTINRIELVPLTGGNG